MWTRPSRFTDSQDQGAGANDQRPCQDYLPGMQKVGAGMKATAIEQARAAGLDPDSRPHAPEARTAEYLLAKMEAGFEREHRRLMALKPRRARA